KPSECVSRIGDSASVQAVTRVNAEQASKRTMRRPTRQPFRGRLIRLGMNERRSTPSRCAGVVATACTLGKRAQHGRPQGVVSRGQADAREGQAGRFGETERFAVPRKPGNAGEGRDLSSRRTQDVVKDLEIGQPINSEECSETAEGIARESEGRS